MSESLSELETELCCLPGVIVTRLVGGSRGRPLGVTVFVAAGTTPGRIRAGIQAIASAHFDIEIDPARMVIIDVSEVTPLPEGPADLVDRAPRNRDDVAASDSSEALAAAQRAVHSLLSTLASPWPDDDKDESLAPPAASVEDVYQDTVVVSGSDTAVAGPASLGGRRRAEDGQHGAQKDHHVLPE